VACSVALFYNHLRLLHDYYSQSWFAKFCNSIYNIWDTQITKRRVLRQPWQVCQLGVTNMLLVYMHEWTVLCKQITLWHLKLSCRHNISNFNILYTHSYMHVKHPTTTPALLMTAFHPVGHALEKFQEA